MSENLKEDRPLLCDEYSDDELRFGISSPKFGRFNHSGTYGRARTHTIGAAAIINRWPDHLSSFLNYWWMGVVMIILIIFVIYNSITAFATLPNAHLRPFKFKNLVHNQQKTAHEEDKTDIFMHVLFTDYDDLNINKYLKHINIFCNKYAYCTCNIIILLQNALNESVNDQINNEVALNSLWMESKIEDKVKLNENISVKILPLTKYMDESPLKKYWRHLPQQFLGFLARCISIWEKGGIAFDPILLTENSPNPVYVERLEHIMFKFRSRIKKPKTNSIPKKKINNIRDVIENLEHLDQDIHEINLSEAENKNTLIDVINFKEKRTTSQSNKKEISGNSENKDVKHTRKNQNNKNMSILYNKNIAFSDESESNYLPTNESINRIQEERASRNLLPMFLEYLFHRPTNTSESTNENSVTLEQATNFINENNHNYTLRKPASDKYYLHKNALKLKKAMTKNRSVKLSIDLKGFVIATETPCHAFIGTVFSNVIKHSHEETLQDLIIAELSIFCKGVLSICNNVDVIL